MDYKLYSPDSRDGERSLKQHCFISKQIQPIFSKNYMGNESLCKKYGLVNDTDNKYLGLDEIKTENLDQNNICKNCLKKAVALNLIQAY